MAFSIKRNLLSDRTGLASGCVEFVLTDNELNLAYHECMRRQDEVTGDWQQWIADVYHCSDCWGCKMTDEEMLLDLVESRKHADFDDYVPDPTLYKECAAYWNELCEAYPN